MSSDSFHPVDEVDAYTETHRNRSYQPTQIFSVTSHGRESRRACVSDVFSSESLWLPYRSSSFSVTLHVAAPSPQAAFSICKSNLLFVLWFCRQCSSILFPAPPPIISAYCFLLHTYTLPHFPPCMASHHQHHILHMPCLSSTIQVQWISCKPLD